jgi:hypothetical protein
MITIVRMVLQGVSVRRSISALVRLPFAVAVIMNIHLPLDYSPSSIISNHRRSPVTATLLHRCYGVFRRKICGTNSRALASLTAVLI